MSQDLSVLEPFLGGLAGFNRVVLQPGATPDQFSAAERTVGFRFPPDLRRFYQACNGLTVSVIRPLDSDEYEPKPRRSMKLNYVPAFRILPLKEAAALYHNPAGEVGFPDLQRTYGLFPFTDAYDSDTYYYGCKSALRGRIIHVRHDDYSYPASRSLKSFLRLVWRTLGMQSDLRFLREGHDFSDWIPLRTPEDDLAARELLRLAAGESLTKEVRHLCRQWAAAMLSPESLEEFAEILDRGNETGRTIAYGRLCHIASPGADRLLRAYHRKKQRFLESLQNAFERAGFDARPKEGSLHVKGVGHMNVEQLFTERHDPKILRDVLARNADKRANDSFA